MHNIKDLRKQLNYYKKKFLERNFDFDIKIFEKLDKINRNFISEKEKLEQEKKIISKSKDKSNFEESKKISHRIAEISKKQIDAQNELNDLLYILPNVSSEEVPVGKDEKSNKIIGKFGEIKNFNFKPKSHIEIGLKNNDIDFETSIKLSGARFVILKDKMALYRKSFN
jgi:Seryl-tRNA synthetase